MDKIIDNSISTITQFNKILTMAGIAIFKITILCKMTDLVTENT